MAMVRFVSGGGLLLALTFNIVALATPAWLISPVASSGLFKSVTPYGSLDRPKTEYEKLVIAFNIISDVFIMFAVPLVIKMGKDGRLLSVGTALSALSAIMILIAMSNYTAHYEDRIRNTSGAVTWGYSFAFGWTAFCLTSISSVIAFALKISLGGGKPSYSDID